MKVIKRNQSVSDVKIEEIREALVWACQGLDVSYLELESHFDAIYTDLITTSQIQRSLVTTALRLTSLQQPDWRFVAARLMLMEHYKNTAIHRGYDSFGYSGDYKGFVHEAVNKGLYDRQILDEYSDEELIIAGNWLNGDYDLGYDFAGTNLLIGRYLINDGDKPFELPQELFLTAALLLAVPETKEERLQYAQEFYHQIASRKISLATPILINLRRSNGNLSSCFISSIDDDLSSIFYTVNQVAQISKNGGGVGVNLSRVRAKGASIQGVPNASGGIIPWIKILNDTAVAVNQLGKRAGAVTTALDLWHLDVEDFLEMQTENGDQRKKAYDVFPQLVVPDLFFNRVEENGVWTLFDPNEIRLKTNIEISELHGEKFEKVYKSLEENESIELRRSLDAREIFKTILKTMVETGMPYLFFKDTVNRLNPNRHDGYIANGNLCQESFSNFRPTTLNPDHSVKEEGLVHTCNLVSLNLANLIESETLKYSTRLAVRILDNTIDLTKTPINESNAHNERYRTIGVGAMGLADYLAYHQIPFEDSSETVDQLFEDISYNAVKASADLAVNRGAYPLCKGSAWHNGIFFGKDKSYFIENSNQSERWLELIDQVQTTGIRNSQILAIAPNTSSALLQGCSSSVLPVFSKFHIDKNTNGAFPVCPPYVKERFWFYKENKYIDQRNLVDVIASIQKWIDQGISFELLFNLNNDIRALDIYETVLKAWKNGCKTIYYTRTIQRDSSVTEKKDECVSCVN
jgi:ribonucleoside-diphosphate reductase alpha chain